MRNYVPKIAKKDLEHGAYYEGTCRNATVARWNGKEGVFIYKRHKFGMTFFDEIKHPEDEQRYDVFVVEKKIDPPEFFEEVIPLTLRK